MATLGAPGPSARERSGETPAAPSAAGITGTVAAGAFRERLSALTSSPVVELNRAVAVAMADGPEAGLAVVEVLAGSGALEGYYLLPATRADLLTRLGRSTEAAGAYREALGLVGTGPERRFLEARLAAVAASKS